MATYRLPVADWTYTSLSDPYKNDRTSPAVSLASGDIGFRSCLFLKFQELFTRIIEVINHDIMPCIKLFSILPPLILLP